jgi:hypothetical protein
VLAGCALALAAAGASAAFSGPVGRAGASGPTGTTGTSGATGATSPVKTVGCPAGIASAGVSSAQWVWSNYGKPSSSATSVSYSQSGGSGTWSSRTAKGTICSQDQGGGQPKRSIVLSVSGASTLSPGIHKLGLLGIGLTLSASVTKSGDQAVCPVGSTGTINLFASYYGTHKDKVTMSFAGTCAAWNETFAGSSLHVEISNHGAMIRPTG